MSNIPYALKTGAVIAGYDIVRVLGAGGFGITYEAASAITGKRVAIKEFFPRGIASRDNATRIIFDEKENEIVAWALKRFESSTTDQCKLSHPNIVEVLHYVKDNSTGYMIMEYVEGQTLEHWLRDRKKTPSPAELVPYIKPILDALQYLHKQNLIHRDIAPDNIMIRPDGKPMIIDFGALKLIQQQTEVRSRTNRSFAVSKQFYSPPEQMDGESDLDARADIYSIAATLYRALAGRPPANSEERTQKLARKKDDPYVPVNTVQPSLDAQVSSAIDRAMSYDADDRPRSIEEFREMLGWGEQQPTVAAPRAPETSKSKNPDMPRQTPPSFAPKAKSPLRWLVPVGGAAAVAAIVLLAFNPFGAKAPDVNIAQQKPVVVTPPPVALKQVTKAPEPEKAPPPPRVETPVAPPKVETPPPPKTEGKTVIGFYVGETRTLEFINRGRLPPHTCFVGATAPIQIFVEEKTVRINDQGAVAEAPWNGQFFSIAVRRSEAHWVYSGSVENGEITGEIVLTLPEATCRFSLTAKYREPISPAPPPNQGPNRVRTLKILPDGSVIPDDQSLPKAEPPPAKVEPPQPPKADPLENMRRDFEAVLRVNTTEGYEQFLRQYPDGLYATLAREGIKRLAMLDAAKLNRALNAELKRVGCGTGASDGNWGDDSERALSLFNQHAQTKFNTKLASSDALDAVRGKPQRVCPLVCGPNQRVQGNTCIAVAPPPTQPGAKQGAPKGKSWCLRDYAGSIQCGFATQEQCLAGRTSGQRGTCVQQN